MMKHLPWRVFIITSLLAALAVPSRAADVRLYLMPASQALAPGATVRLAIRVDTGGEAVNAVQANVNYPADKFEFIRIDGGGSALGIAAESKGGGGSAQVARAALQPVSGDQLVATVVLRAKAAGTAQVAWADGSSVLRASDSRNILSATTGGSYDIKDRGPVIQSCPTNPASIGRNFGWYALPALFGLLAAAAVWRLRRGKGNKPR